MPWRRSVPWGRPLWSRLPLRSGLLTARRRSGRLRPGRWVAGGWSRSRWTRLGRAPLLRLCLIVHLHRGGGLHVAIGRKRLADGRVGRAAMIDVRKLGLVGAGNMLILDLRP